MWAALGVCHGSQAAHCATASNVSHLTHIGLSDAMKCRRAREPQVHAPALTAVVTIRRSIRSENVARPGTPLRWAICTTSQPIPSGCIIAPPRARETNPQQPEVPLPKAFEPREGQEPHSLARCGSGVGMLRSSATAPSSSTAARSTASSRECCGASASRPTTKTASRLRCMQPPPVRPGDPGGLGSSIRRPLISNHWSAPPRRRVPITVPKSRARAAN